LKNFFINIALIFVLAVALLFCALSVLSWYTNHNQYIQVPDVRGMSFDEAKITLEKNGLNPIINDSTYIEKALPLSIVTQNPEAKTDVKNGRTIYLTINTGKTPTVSAPKFVDMSFTLAQAVMKNKGLKVGKIITAYDEIGNNLVLTQFYRGDTLRPGTLIPKGSVIDLTVASTDRSKFPELDSLQNDSINMIPDLGI